MSLTPGTRIGAYDVLAPRGAGGMGEVYRARDTRLDRVVALKILPSRIADDPDLQARFEREARSVAKLNHPNVLGVYDLGTDGGVRYIAMELVEGVPIAGPMPPRRLAEVAAQIADGLAAAHAAGVVHRDLKPDNILRRATDE